MNRHAIVIASSGCALIAVFAFVLFADSAKRNADDRAYRTIDAAFSVRRSQGWTLTSAPTDGRRYRICGATESDPQSTVVRFTGSFSTGGQTVPFDVAIPDGNIVAVEGLQPQDGGALTYAVLVRPKPITGG